MKITCYQLIQSTNALDRLLKHKENQANSKLTGQIKNLLFDVYIQNEISKWNNLTGEEKEYVAEKEVDLPIDKITEKPKMYANSDIDALQRLIKPKLKQQQTQIEKLLEEKE